MNIYTCCIARGSHYNRLVITGISIGCKMLKIIMNKLQLLFRGSSSYLITPSTNDIKYLKHIFLLSTLFISAQASSGNGDGCPLNERALYYQAYSNPVCTHIQGSTRAETALAYARCEDELRDDWKYKNIQYIGELPSGGHGFSATVECTPSESNGHDCTNEEPVHWDVIPVSIHAECVCSDGLPKSRPWGLQQAHQP